MGPLLSWDSALLECCIRGGGRERVHQGEAKKKPGLLKPAAAEEAEIWKKKSHHKSVTCETVESQRWEAT